MPNGTVNGAGPCPIGNPPKTGIPNGLVQVRQSILVAPSEVVTPAIEGVGRISTRKPQSVRMEAPR